MKIPNPPPNGAKRSGNYCTQYVNRWGQLMIAEHYGYRAWRFRK